MINRILIAFILLFVTWISGCQTMIEKRQDVLIDKIYYSKSKTEIPYQVLLQKMLDSQVIYLGERHDNAYHHQIQLRVLTDLVKAGKKPLIGFEFFSFDQTSHIMSFIQTPPHKTSTKYLKANENSLRQKLGWLNHNNESWQFYFQLIQFAQKNKLTAFGSDLPKGLIKRLVKPGIKHLTPVEKSLIHSTNLNNPDYKELMFSKFKAAHCGYSNQKMSESMYQSWLARNDAMAHSIVAMQNDDMEKPVVMILGGGHTEHNMAVYERVAFLKPNLKQLNLGMQEIAIQPLSVNAYLETTITNKTEFRSAFEYFWFTQRSSYEDPCEKFKKQLKQMQNHPKPHRMDSN